MFARRAAVVRLRSGFRFKTFAERVKYRNTYFEKILEKPLISVQKKLIRMHSNQRKAETN